MALRLHGCEPRTASGVVRFRTATACQRPLHATCYLVAPWSSGRRRGFAVSCLNFSTLQCCEPLRHETQMKQSLLLTEPCFLRPSLKELPHRLQSGLNYTQGVFRECKSALMSRKIRIRCPLPKFLERRCWVQVRFCSTHGEALYDATQQVAPFRTIQL